MMPAADHCLSLPAAPPYTVCTFAAWRKAGTAGGSAGDAAPCMGFTSPRSAAAGAVGAPPNPMVVSPASLPPAIGTGGGRRGLRRNIQQLQAHGITKEDEAWLASCVRPSAAGVSPPATAHVRWCAPFGSSATYPSGPQGFASSWLPAGRYPPWGPHLPSLSAPQNGTADRD